MLPPTFYSRFVLCNKCVFDIEKKGCLKKMTEFEGTFKNESNELLDEYFAAIGIPWIARKMMTSSTPTIEISKKDEKWTVKTSTMMSNSSTTFSLGDQYEETMMGGRTIKNVTTIEGNKMITESESDRGKSKKVLEFSGEGFVMIMTHEKTDIVAKRHFKRV